MASLKEYKFLALMALFIIAVFLPGIAVAQSGTGVVYGTVTGQGGNVIADCKVTIQGTNIEAFTGLDGAYRLAPVPVGEHTIVFDYLGLQAGSATVTVVAGEPVNQDMTLVYAGEIEVRGSPLLVGQAKALNRQKNNINISNIVAADQIGRFPDKNASEATQRIPAVSLLRDQGEGRYVIIRGTEARLNSTTVNGERIPSPEAGTRSIALDTIPADLLAFHRGVKDPETGHGRRLHRRHRRSGDQEGARGNPGLGIAGCELQRIGGGNGTDVATATFGTRFGPEKKWGLLLSGSGSDTKRGSDNIEPEYDDGELDVLDMRDYTIQRERYGITGDLDYRAVDHQQLFSARPVDELRRHRTPARQRQRGQRRRTRTVHQGPSAGVVHQLPDPRRREHHR